MPVWLHELVELLGWLFIGSLCAAGGMATVGGIIHACAGACGAGSEDEE